MCEQGRLMHVTVCICSSGTLMLACNKYHIFMSWLIFLSLACHDKNLIADWDPVTFKHLNHSDQLQRLARVLKMK